MHDAGLFSTDESVSVLIGYMVSKYKSVYVLGVWLSIISIIVASSLDLWLGDGMGHV